MSALSEKAVARRNWLKMRTRLLIAACGGLDMASEVCAAECRPYSVQQLSRCQNPNAPDMLPIDILDCLEAHCGKAVVSGVIASGHAQTGTVGELRDEASEATETAAELQRHIREALADGQIDPVEAGRGIQIAEAGIAHMGGVVETLKPLMKRGL